MPKKQLETASERLSRLTESTSERLIREQLDSPLERIREQTEAATSVFRDDAFSRIARGALGTGEFARAARGLVGSDAFGRAAQGLAASDKLSEAVRGVAASQSMLASAQFRSDLSKTVAALTRVSDQLSPTVSAISKALDTGGLMARTQAITEHLQSAIASGYLDRLSTFDTGALSGLASSTLLNDRMFDAQKSLSALTSNMMGTTYPATPLSEELRQGLARWAENLAPELPEEDREEIRAKIERATRRPLTLSEWLGIIGILITIAIWISDSTDFTDQDRAALANVRSDVEHLTSLAVEEISRNEHFATLPQGFIIHGGNVREEPHGSAQQTHRLAKDTTVGILAKSERWYFITFRQPGTGDWGEGWIWGGSVELMSPDT